MIRTSWPLATFLSGRSPMRPPSSATAGLAALPGQGVEAAAGVDRRFQVAETPTLTTPEQPAPWGSVAVKATR